MVACAPGIVPYLVSKNYDWKKCLKLAIVFNIPRIIILTIFGVIIGIVAYLISKELFENEVLPLIFNLQIVGYGLLGIFIFIFGAHMFITSIDRREDLLEGTGVAHCGSNSAMGKDKTVITKNAVDKKSDAVACKPQKRSFPSFLRGRFGELEKKPNKLFFVWGGILSIACLGEVGLIEMTMISGTIGFISDTMLNAALFGGLCMFLFAVGAAMPIILVSVISSSIKDYFKNIENLETIRTIGAIVMIMMGLAFMFQLASYLVSTI